MQRRRRRRRCSSCRRRNRRRRRRRRHRRRRHRRRHCHCHRRRRRRLHTLAGDRALVLAAQRRRPMCGLTAVSCGVPSPRPRNGHPDASVSPRVTITW